MEILDAKHTEGITTPDIDAAHSSPAKRQSI